MPSILYTYQQLNDVVIEIEEDGEPVEVTLPGLINDLPLIKSLNIDVVMNYYYTDNDSSPASAVAMLDAYFAAGLKGLIRLGPAYTQKVIQPSDYTALATFVNALKDHPALYGWYTNDEPALSGSSVDYPTGQISTVYGFIKDLDPAHECVVVYPGYGAGFWPDGSGITTYPYSPANQDLFGIDTYPVAADGSYGRLAAESLSSYTGTHVAFQQCLADSATNVTDMTETFFVMQAYTTAGSMQPTGTLLTEMTDDVAAAGWCSRGIAFWMWQWYDNFGVSTLRANTDAHAATAAIALQYHEDLYSTPQIKTANIIMQ